MTAHTDIDAAYRQIFNEHPDDWLTWSRAAEVVGCPVSTIDWYTRTGRIERRPQYKQRPTLARSSVEEFRNWWHAEQQRRQQQLPRTPSPPRLQFKDGHVTLRTAAEQLGVSAHHVPYLVSTGKVIGVLDGGRWWIEISSLSDYAEDRERWVSRATAHKLTGISLSAIDRAIRDGQVERRSADQSLPSLDRVTLLAWAEQHRVEQHEVALATAARRAEREARSAGPPDDGHVWLDQDAAALVLRINSRRLARLTLQEKVPATRKGGRWWYRRDLIEQRSAAQAFAPSRATAP